MRREIHNLSTSMISHHSSLRGFRQFWSHHKSTLVIQTLKGYEDIDTFSIEMVKEHDKTRVVLPSLAKKVHLQKKSFYAVSTSASIFFMMSLTQKAFHAWLPRIPLKIPQELLP